MNTQHRIQAALACCACLAATTTDSADYALTWWATAGGGGASTGGNYAIRGTLGQPGTGCSTSSAYSIEGGFWCVATVPTPEAPRLSISRFGRSVAVSWPRPGTGWALEQTSTLTGNPPPWALVPANQLQTNATDIFLVVPSPVGSKFYRLQPGP